MENYYEYLKIDMSASQDEIKQALERVGASDDAYVRKIKSILLNENFKSEYDRKLADYIINGEKQEGQYNFTQSDIANKIKEFTSGEVNDKYVITAIVLLVVNLISSLAFSSQVDFVVSILVMIGTIFVLYNDWLVLKKNNMATFSKWWVLIYPVYLYKRANAKKESKRYFWIFIAIGLVFIACSAAFQGGRLSWKALPVIPSAIYIKTNLTPLILHVKM